MSRREDFTEAVQRHWGSNDIEAMFPEGAPRSRRCRGAPPGARRRNQDYDPDLVHKALTSPPQVQEIDPRNLRATQPMVTRPGVDYYLNDPTYKETGETFADKGNLGNQFPTVYRRPTMADPSQTEDVLLTGHHRATADLLRGRPTRGRVVEGPWGPPRKGQVAHVTALLSIGEGPAHDLLPAGHHHASSIGEPVTVSTPDGGSRGAAVLRLQPRTTSPTGSTTPSSARCPRT